MKGYKELSIRLCVVLLLSIFFCVGIIGFVSVPSQVWRLFEWWQITFYALILISEFCMILISYWVWRDQEELDRLKHELTRQAREKEKT